MTQEFKNSAAFLIGFALVLVVYLWSTPVNAYDHNHDHDITLQLVYPEDNDSVTGAVGNDDYDMFMAMSAAGDTCVFDYADGWQGCGGMGWSGSAEAFNGSLVTRIDNMVIRFNLQADSDFDEYAGGVGGSWHF